MKGNERHQSPCLPCRCFASETAAGLFILLQRTAWRNAIAAVLLVSPASAQDTVGPYFRVDFQEGFEGWKTVLFLEGELVYKGSPGTDPVTGLADGIELMGRSTLVELRLVIRAVGVDTTLEADIQSFEFIGLNVLAGEGGVRHARILQSTMPFGYD